MFTMQLDVAANWVKLPAGSGIFSKSRETKCVASARSWECIHFSKWACVWNEQTEQRRLKHTQSVRTHALSEKIKRAESKVLFRRHKDGFSQLRARFLHFSYTARSVCLTSCSEHTNTQKRVGKGNKRGKELTIASVFVLDSEEQQPPGDAKLLLAHLLFHFSTWL
jgi:hypothetical protein